MEADVRAILPHRYPFLLVDRLVSARDDKFEAIKNVTFNEPHFSGHFPDEPVMPGVLVIEALAQAAGLALGAAAEDAPGTGYLTGIDEARFRRKVVPGDQLRLESTAEKISRAICKYSARATVDGQLVAEAKLMCAIRQLED